MKAFEIIEYLEGFAPNGIQENWDNSGICIGDRNSDVSGVYVALDCTPDVVKEAVACGANMIITHHPLIFTGQKSVLADDKIGKVIISLIREGIVLYSTHTPADKAVDGVSWVLARRLGLEDVSVLDCENESGQGLGTVGYLPLPMSYMQFVSYVKERLCINMIRSSRPLDGPVRKVALCGGSGSSLLGLARRKGADCLVTADVKYHDFYTEDGIAIMDIGHYESEIGIVDTIFMLIKKNFPNFAVYKTEKNQNLVYYY